MNISRYDERVAAAFFAYLLPKLEEESVLSKSKIRDNAIMRANRLAVWVCSGDVCSAPGCVKEIPRPRMEDGPHGNGSGMHLTPINPDMKYGSGPALYSNGTRWDKYAATLDGGYLVMCSKRCAARIKKLRFESAHNVSNLVR